MALIKRKILPDTPAAITPPASRENLVSLMIDGSTQAARRAAIQDLAADPEAVTDLVSALHPERDPAIQAAILAALVSIGTDDAAAGIADTVFAVDAGLRNSAVCALHELGGKANSQIERLLASPHPEQRIIAVGLLDQKDPHARLLLHRTLANDPDLNVGLAAVEVLSLIGDPADEIVLRAFELRYAGNAFVSFAVKLACSRASAGDLP